MADHRFEAFKLSLGSAPSAAPLTRDSLNSIPISYASCSLGCKPEHTVPKRIEAIAHAGFTGMELSMPDLVDFANQHLRPKQQDQPSSEISNKDYDDLCATARVVKTMCDAKGIEIMLLQPFANFEGWPKGSDMRKEAWERVHGWVRIMESCGCRTLQVGSTDTPADNITTDREFIVNDLRELADHLAEKGLRVAYENWCWSTHAPDWSDVWDICKRVDRTNFGLCLDTFQSAGGEWGDPTTSSALVEDGRTAEQVEKDWKASCERLSSTVPQDKIFLLQISDAYKPYEPFAAEADKDGMRPRARWSGKYRPLPYEGYLPVVDFTKAVLKTGFRGWFSYEIFDEGPDGKGKDYELQAWMEAARECQERLVSECVEQ